MTNDTAGSSGSSSNAGGGGGGNGKVIAGWVAAIVVAGIFVMGAMPKFTGNAAPLEGKLPGGNAAIIGIGVVEVIAIALILIPKTSAIGAALAVFVMLGAIGSHIFGPVGMEGDAASMLPMAIVAFLAAATVLFLKKDQLPIGAKA